MNRERNDIIQEIGDSFSHFKRSMHLYMFQAFGGLGLSPAQLATLRTIYDGQPISHKRLAAAMQLTPGAVSQIIDALDEAHCITRTQNQADRRVSYLSISRSGKHLLDSYSKLRTKLLTNAFADLPLEDLRTFIKVQQTATDWLNQQVTSYKKESS